MTIADIEAYKDAIDYAADNEQRLVAVRLTVRMLVAFTKHVAETSSDPTIKTMAGLILC